MTKQRYVAISFLLAAIAVFIWCGLPSSEPVYKGKRLSAWLHEYSDEPETAQEAIRQMGTNCLPTALRRLRATDSSLKLKLVQLLHRLPQFHLEITTAEQKWVEAHAIFSELGLEVRAAVPALAAELRNANVENRKRAGVALRLIGPPASNAIPDLIVALSDADNGVRYCATTALSRMGSAAGAAVPALTKTLNDSQRNTRSYAAVALRNVGPAAQSVVPALTQMMLTDPVLNNRVIAASAVYAVTGKSDQVVPILIHVFENGNWIERQNAAFDLGRIGAAAKEAVPSLLRAAQGGDREIQKAAINALKLIDPASAAKAGSR